MNPRSRFRVVAIDHGFPTTEPEEQIFRAAGGEFLNVEGRPYPVAMAFCHEAQAVMCRRITVTEAMIEHFYTAKFLLRYGGGADNVDVPAATLHKIMVGSIPQYCTEETALHTIALLLACVRNLLETHRKVAAGGWDLFPPEKLGRMSQRTLGLVGFGSVGQAVAKRLQGWGLTMLASDPYADKRRAELLGVRLVTLDALCASSDYISLHLPLLPETRHLFNARLFALMKSGTILINTARGAVVNTEDLVEALAERRVGRVGLDVFEEEPLPPNSPFRKHPRVLFTDHNAWYSEESQAAIQKLAAEEVVRVCSGQLPQALANPEVLPRIGYKAAWNPPEQLLWQLKRAKTLPPAPLPRTPLGPNVDPKLLEVAKSLRRM